MAVSEQAAPNAAQIEFWNAVPGRTWAELQELLDRQIEPLGKEAMRVLAPAAGERILDIGCGCGHTTLDLAERVGPSGAVLGIDISRPMLEVARQRPAVIRPDFLEIDAQIAPLATASFDAAFSRFGVMFFSDPVAAFANIRQALKPGGRIGFVCWRSYQENPWMRAPVEAAQPFLPPSPPSDPLAPGPFAFADDGRIGRILADAGFQRVEIDPFDAMIGGSDLDQTLGLTFRVGPLGAALRENPGLLDKVAEPVRAVLSSYVTPRGVMIPAAAWIVQAKVAL
jgi:SAM-dependent methyltransferase